MKGYVDLFSFFVTMPLRNDLVDFKMFVFQHVTIRDKIVLEIPLSGSRTNQGNHRQCHPLPPAFPFS